MAQRPDRISPLPPDLFFHLCAFSSFRDIFCLSLCSKRIGGLFLSLRNKHSVTLQALEEARNGKRQKIEARELENGKGEINVAQLSLVQAFVKGNRIVIFSHIIRLVGKESASLLQTAITHTRNVEVIGCIIDHDKANYNCHLTTYLALAIKVANLPAACELYDRGANPFFIPKENNPMSNTLLHFAAHKKEFFLAFYNYILSKVKDETHLKIKNLATIPQTPLEICTGWQRAAPLAAYIPNR